MTFIYKIVKGTARRFNYENQTRNLRNSCDLKLTTAVKSTSQNALFYKGIKLYNSLPKVITEEIAFCKLKSLLKDHIMAGRLSS